MAAASPSSSLTAASPSDASPSSTDLFGMSQFIAGVDNLIVYIVAVVLVCMLCVSTPLAVAVCRRRRRRAHHRSGAATPHESAGVSGVVRRSSDTSRRKGRKSGALDDGGAPTAAAGAGGAAAAAASAPGQSPTLRGGSGSVVNAHSARRVPSGRLADGATGEAHDGATALRGTGALRTSGQRSENSSRRSRDGSRVERPSGTLGALPEHGGGGGGGGTTTYSTMGPLIGEHAAFGTRELSGRPDAAARNASTRRVRAAAASAHSTLVARKSKRGGTPVSGVSTTTTSELRSFTVRVPYLGNAQRTFVQPRDATVTVGAMLELVLAWVQSIDPSAMHKQLALFKAAPYGGARKVMLRQDEPIVVYCLDQRSIVLLEEVGAGTLELGTSGFGTGGGSGTGDEAAWSTIPVDDPESPPTAQTCAQCHHGIALLSSSLCAYCAYDVDKRLAAGSARAAPPPSRPLTATLKAADIEHIEFLHDASADSAGNSLRGTLGREAGGPAVVDVERRAGESVTAALERCAAEAEANPRQSVGYIRLKNAFK